MSARGLLKEVGDSADDETQMLKRPIPSEDSCPLRPMKTGHYF
jgi:hypothetical protein